MELLKHECEKAALINPAGNTSKVLRQPLPRRVQGTHVSLESLYFNERTIEPFQLTQEANQKFAIAHGGIENPNPPATGR